jgi:hypothetical protein
VAGLNVRESGFSIVAEAPKLQHVLAVLISKQDTPSQGANPGRRSLILVDATNR